MECLTLVVCPSVQLLKAPRRIVGSDRSLLHSPNCEQARIHLAGADISVVICEGTLPDGNWKDILKCAAQTKNAPSLIVTSNHADEALWAEVLNLGGYDVLAQPLDDDEVLRVLASAARTTDISKPRV